jgi:integrase/recombinase XerD
LLQAVEPGTLEEWATSMRSDGYSGTSVRRKFATARVFFAYWLRKGILEQSPLWRIRLDLGRELILPRSLSPGEAQRLMEEAWRGVDTSQTVIFTPRDPRFLCMRNLVAMEILFATGMRIGELVNLRLVDWQEDETSLLVRGKGSRQRLAFLPDERSRKALRTYLWHRAGAGLNHDALLVNASGKSISTQGIARRITEAAVRATIATRVTPHMIRHTVATLLLRYGADIRVVQEVLGHASISTTQRYTHVAKDHLLATLRKCHPNHHLSIQTVKLAS